MPKHNIVYGLIDPRTLLIFYIGLSSRGMQRPAQHKRVDTSSLCHQQIKELQGEGLDYQIVILEEVEDSQYLAKAERWWIAYGKCCGWPLTNSTKGGEFHENAEFGIKDLYIPEHANAARVFGLLKLVCKKHGTEKALQDAQHVLTAPWFEHFKAVMIKHEWKIQGTPHEMRLACRCGYRELFHDQESLVAAVHKLNSHVRDMAERPKTITWRNSLGPATVSAEYAAAELEKRKSGKRRRLRG